MRWLGRSDLGERPTTAIVFTRDSSARICSPAGFANTAAILCVKARLALGTRLEAPVHPIVLLGHLEHFLLDVGVHAARVGLDILGREILPRRLEAGDVARPA